MADNTSTQPHAVYSVLVHGVFSRWLFISRTIPDILILLEDKLNQVLIPALTGHPLSSLVVILLSSRLGGLGNSNPSKLSVMTTALVISQDMDRLVSYGDINSINDAKKDIRNSNHLREICQANNLNSQHANTQKRLLFSCQGEGLADCSIYRGARGFFLNKGEFMDALHLRY